MNIDNRYLHNLRRTTTDPDVLKRAADAVWAIIPAPGEYRGASADLHDLGKLWSKLDIDREIAARELRHADRLRAERLASGPAARIRKERMERSLYA